MMRSRGWVGAAAATAVAIGVIAWLRPPARPVDGRDLEVAAGETDPEPTAKEGLAARPRPLGGEPALAARILGRVTADGDGVPARVIGWDLGGPQDDDLAARNWGREFRMRGIGLPDGNDLEAWLGDEVRAGIPSRLAAPATRDAETTSDASGAFSLLVPASNGHWLLVARREDGALGVAVSRGSLAGTREAVEIALVNGAESLSLRVLDPEGRPVPGIVRVERASAERQVGDIAGARRIDESGRARFERLARRPHVAIVEWGSGSTWTSEPLDVPYGGECRLVVDAAGPGVRGVVRGEGDAPLAGAVVRSSVRSPGGYAALRATTGADGTFALPGSRSTVREIGATAVGYEPAAATPGDGDEPVEIRLRATPVIRGRVVAAATGKPVPGVRVVRADVSNRFGITQEDDFGFTRSGTDGRFTLAGRPGMASLLVAYGGGWMSAELDGARADGSQAKVVPAADGGTRGDAELRVVPAGRLEGIVRDADGGPVEGATVSLSQSDRMHGGCGNCWFRQPILPYLPDPDPVRTAADGRFAFDTVLPGLLHEVGAFREGLSARTDVTLDDPGTTTITLTFPRAPGDASRSPTPVDVVVTEDDGRTPIAGATVSLTPEGSPSRRSTTGQGGIARFEDVPGVGGAASVTADRHAPAYVGGLSHAPAEGATRRVLAVLLERTREIRGRVVDPEGRPVPVADASLWSRSLAPTTREAAWTSDGQFVFRDVPSGGFTVSATLHRDDRDLSGEAKGTADADVADVVIRLTERVTAAPQPARAAAADVTIRVVGPDGALVPSGLYHSRKPEWAREYDTHLSFRAGTFTTSVAVFGTEIVEIFDARSATGERLGPGSTPILSRADEGTTVEVRLGKAVSIDGRVVGPTGDPVAGARVAAHVPAGRRGRRPGSALATATTDERGAFTIEGLAREAYELDVDVPPGCLTPPARPVAAPGDGVVITLRPAVRPTVSVVDDAGAPVANAVVVAGPPGTVKHVSDWDRTLPRTGPRGRVTLDRIDPGAVYDVAIESGGRYLPFRRDGWSPADTTFVLAAPATVAGRILGPDRQPIPGAWIAVVPSEGSTRAEATVAAVVGPEGSFTIGMLPAGDVWLRFGVGTGGGQRVVRVRAPATGVELVAESGPTLVFRFEGYPEGQAPSIVATLTTWAPDGRVAESETRLRPGADGVVRFPGLPRDRRFTLHACLDDADLLGWIPDLGIEPLPRPVALVPGGTIRGTVRFPSEEAASHGAYVELEGPGFRALVAPEEDGTFELKAVPPGRWRVTATSISHDGAGAAPSEASAEAAPGDVIELAIRAPSASGAK